jgi:hypothetical protein
MSRGLCKVEFYSSYPVTAIMSLFFIAICNKATRFVDTQRRWKINEGINHRWLLLVKRICAYLVMKSTSPLLPGDVGLSVEELALAARGRELTYFLFVCFSLRLCDVSGRSRSQTAGATRRCSSDFEKSMPRSHHLICACVVDSSAENFLEETNNGEQSLIDELTRFSNCIQSHRGRCRCFTVENM